MNDGLSFVSSGALSRSHYKLVCKVETAESAQLVDHYLSEAVVAARRLLAQPRLSQKEGTECLVILLYCRLSSCTLTAQLFDFAIPYAITLAEAGSSVAVKRIGYLFCLQIMPGNHELNLMLVNTLRKDIHDSSVQRICLALDTVIAKPMEDVIPAVESRLYDLLSHNSPLIRRRTLHAIRSLSLTGPSLLTRVRAKIMKRINDNDNGVSRTALVTAATLLQIEPSSRDDLKRVVNDLLKAKWSDRSQPDKWLLGRILNILQSLGLTADNELALRKTVSLAIRSREHVLLRQVFIFLEAFPDYQRTHHRLIPYIRTLLTSRDPNDQYLFLSTLQSINPKYWAGTTVDIPPVLEEWEVHRIMRFLDSDDPLIRTMTLLLLNTIDSTILEAYYHQYISTLSSHTSLSDRIEHVCRLLQVLTVSCAADGRLFAGKVQEILHLVEPSSKPLASQPVVERVVEIVLVRNRQAERGFQIGCATSFLSSVVNVEVNLGSTSMVIAAALACEYCGQTGVDHSSLLHGFSSRLRNYPLTVADACLLSMTRIVADCEIIPPEVLESVQVFGQSSRQYIRRRCNQFLDLASKRERLVDIVKHSSASTLPEFLEALQMSSQATPAVKSPFSSTRNLTENDLRYGPYVTPQAAPRSHNRRQSGLDELGRPSSQTSSAGENPMPVTAGDLALTAGQELELMTLKPPQTVQIREDLITLDSPYIFDVPNVSDADFEKEWSELPEPESRGWSVTSVEQAVPLLQSLAAEGLKVMIVERHSPEDDLKVLLSGSTSRAALRLRECEDETCLWRARCDSALLHTRVQEILKDRI